MGMRKIYREVARKYGVTVQEVKREMQAAIDAAYTNTPNDGVTRAWQNRVPRKGEMPTAEELIRYMAREAKDSENI